MSTKKLVMIPAIAFAMMGCTKMSPAQLALDNVASGNIDKSSRPACEIQRTEYALNTNLVSFELTDSGGLNAGFSILTGFLKLLSLDFTADSGKLTVGMELVDPMVPNVKLLSVSGGGRSFNFGVSVDAGFENIGAGLSYNHSTPLVNLATDSLNDGFTNLTDAMTDKQAAWKSQVLAIPSPTQFVIPAGSYSNIKMGDEFAIYNVVHQWEGEPCASNYVAPFETTTLPLVIGRVDQLTNNGAVLTLMCSEQDPCDHLAPVEIGATVKIYKLTEANRVLARSVNIHGVNGGLIKYEESKTVDIGPYLNDIINGIAQNYNFIVVQ